MIAPILFLEKKKNKNIAFTNFEKIKEVITVIPDNLIDRLHKKVVVNQIKEVKEIKDKPNFKLLKFDNENSSTFVLDNDSSKSVETLTNSKDENKSTFVLDNDSEKDFDYKNDLENEKVERLVNDKDLTILINAIFSYKIDNMCPSVSVLGEKTGFEKALIYDLKKELIDLNILETEKRKTIIRKTKEEALKVLKGGVFNAK